jgi:hypothetical protein
MRKIEVIGIFIIALMISLASCAPARTNNAGVNKQPKVIVVNKSRPNKKVIVVNNHRNRFGNNRGRGRGGRVIIIR